MFKQVCYKYSITCLNKLNGTQNSNISEVHKLIYRHKYLWLEIDLDQSVLREILRNLKQ